MAVMLIQINKREAEIKTQYITGCLISLMLVQHNKLKLQLNVEGVCLSVLAMTENLIPILVPCVSLKERCL